MASRWFQPVSYFYNKLADMPYATATDGAQQLVDAFNAGGYAIAGIENAQIIAAADQLEQHFYDHGMKENVSPNGYFDVTYYANSKIQQLNAQGTQQPPEGPWGNTWTRAALDRAMEIADLSYWEHYLNHGMSEGINPSAEFITDDYITAKRIQLNSLATPQPLPEGFEGQTEWTNEAVIRAFQIANLNPIQHYEDYVKTGQETLEGFTPGPEPEPTGEEVRIESGKYEYTDGGKSVNFVATSATLDSRDSITGTGDDDQFTASLDGLFGGFQRGGMTGVSIVNLTANTDTAGFRATNIKGAETYNLDGAISLVDLNSDVKTINLSNAAYGVEFTLDSAAQKGDTTLNIGVSNVVGSNADGDAEAVDILIKGVETVNLNSTGDVTNMIALEGVPAMTALNVTGTADLEVANVDAKLATVNAAEMTADLTVNVGKGAKLTSFTGGQGEDTLVYGAGATRVNIESTGLETLKLNDTGSNVTVNGAKMQGLQNLAIEDQGNTVTLQNFGDTVTLTATGSNSANINAAKVANFTLDVDASSQFTGNLQLADATSLTINANGTDESDSANVTLSSGGNLQNVNNLAVGGVGKVDLSNATNLGAKAATLMIDATDLDGNLSAVAKGSNAKEGSLFFYGGDSGSSAIVVGTNFNFVQLNSGSGTDTFDLSGWSAADAKDKLELTADDNDYIIVDTANVKAFKDLSLGGKVVDMAGYIAGIKDDLDGNTVTVAATGGLFTAGAAKNETLDASGVSFADPDQQVQWNVGNGGTLLVGDLTTKTTVDVSDGNTAGGTASFTYTGNDDGEITLNTSASKMVADPSTGWGGLETLELTNSGSGDLTINPVTNQTTGGSPDYNVGFAGIKDVTISAAEGGSINIPLNGTPTSTPGLTTANVCMPSVSNMVLTGEGDINISAVVGSAKNPGVLKVDATGLSGELTLSTLAQQIHYDGGDGGSDVQCQLHGVASAGTLATGQTTAGIFNLGSGQDNLQLFMWGAADAVNAKATVDLAADGVTDTITVWSPANVSKNLTSTVTISGFELGTDQLQNQGATTGGALGSVDYLSVTSTNKRNFTGAVKNLFALTDAPTAIENGGNVDLAYSQASDGTYNIYAIMGCKGEGDGFAALTISGGTVAAGMVGVCLTGIDSISGLTSDALMNASA